MRQNENNQTTYQITMISDRDPSVSLTLQFEVPSLLSIFRKDLFVLSYKIFRLLNGRHVSLFIEELYERENQKDS